MATLSGAGWEASYKRFTIAIRRSPDSLKIAQRIRERAEERGMTAGQFAFNWVINNACVSAAVAGPRTLEQWRENLGALAGC
jgi:aryl-alcohol dehydrogenase-like predicted oxidoreductase